MAVLSCLRILLIWNLLVCANGGTFVIPPSSTVYTSAEENVLLPCKFLPADGEVVIQVIWNHVKTDGTEVQIITAHRQEGQQESPAYAGRVRFEDSNPMINSALIMLNAVLSDEGSYTCTIATFPSGTLKSQVSLTVWTKPISTLDPVVLVERQDFRLAATCRAMAKPQPGLSWETDLPGQSQNRSMDNGVASIQYFLHPLRRMNGRKLDCLVWHPSLKSPRRLTNQLIVHYPPEAIISGYDENWYLGMEGARLQCDGEGNPKPHNFTWTRKDDGLPDGVTVEKETLKFNRPLRLTDKGVYECVTTNTAGSGKVDLLVEVREKKTSFVIVLMIIIGGVAGMLVLILVIVVIIVNRHHKQKNRQLAMELNEKKEEISTLSRQASIRRVASTSIEKYQMEESIPLRVEGTIRTSLSSLERPRSRDSHSTLGGLDSLGRPAIYNTSRRGRERPMDREKDGERGPSRPKIDPYSRSSDMSLVHPPSPFSMEQTAEIIRSRNGSAILPADGRPQSGGGSITGSRAGSRGHHSPLNSMYPTHLDNEDMRPVDEGSEVSRGQIEPDGMDNGGSETASSQISEAMSNHFEHTNGTLWPKQKPNSILLAPEITRFPLVHTNMIHHPPQIV